MNEMSGGAIVVVSCGVWCVVTERCGAVVSTSSYVRSAGGGRTDHQDASQRARARGDKITKIASSGEVSR